MAQEPKTQDPQEPRHVEFPTVEGLSHEPDEHAIRERAHAIWVTDGPPEGREVDHWMRARRELEHEAAHK
jgi:hypothetical protein